MNFKIFLIAFILILLAGISGLFDPVNNRLYDYYLHLNKKNSVNPNIIIIEIDEKSIKKLGYWPWSRTIYTKVIDKLIKASPAVIGLHISFTETQGKQDDDRLLYSILKSFPDIVIGTKLVKSNVNNMKVIIPENNLFPDIKQGHTVFNEQDVIRSFPPFKVVPAFSLEVLSLYYKKNQHLYKLLDNNLKELLYPDEKSSYSISQNLLIDYKRTPDKFIHYSFVDILEDKIPLSDFKNKIILIGVTDRYLTPYLANPLSYQEKVNASPLVEFQAQIIDSLLNFRHLKAFPDWIVYILSTFIAGLFLWATTNKRVFLQGIIFSSLFVMLVLISFMLFKYFALWFPPAFILSFITILFGVSTYLTVNKIDLQLIKTIKELIKEEQLPLTELPTNINHKVNVLNGLINVIANDRKTIKAIIYGITNPVIVIDTTGKILWSNGCFTRLFKDKLVLNENIQNLVIGINIDELNNLRSLENVYKAEVSIFNREYVCLAHSSDRHNNQYVIVFNDITELKEIDRLKTDMMRMVSHELKVPLTQIIMAAENQPYRDNHEQVLQDSTNILNAAELMKSTITNFLQLNKLESNVVDVELDEQNLVEVIQRAIDLQSLLAEKRNIKIIFKHEEIHKVIMNKNLMEIVINNLLSNAIKYSLDNQEVKIKVYNQDKKAHLEVIDSGIGIKKEEINKLTEKFYRASNNKEHNISGTGLGLSIVQLILNIHKSNLIIESDYNQGATFAFSLDQAS